MPKVPEIRSLHIFTISPEKLGDEVKFLPAGKYKRFLQTFSQSSQNSKYVISAISQGKRKGWSWFFASRLTSKVSSNWHSF